MSNDHKIIHRGFNSERYRVQCRHFFEFDQSTEPQIQKNEWILFRLYKFASGRIQSFLSFDQTKKYDTKKQEFSWIFTHLVENFNFVALWISHRCYAPPPPLPTSLDSTVSNSTFLLQCCQKMNLKILNKFRGKKAKESSSGSEAVYLKTT